MKAFLVINNKKDSLIENKKNIKKEEKEEKKKKSLNNKKTNLKTQPINALFQKQKKEVRELPLLLSSIQNHLYSILSLDRPTY